MGEDLEKFIERYPTYIEALEMLEDKDQRIAELEQEIDNLNAKITQMEEQDMIFHNQLAIQELEKVKEKIDCEMAIREYDISEQTADVCVSIAEQIDQQIKELKGE